MRAKARLFHFPVSHSGSTDAPMSTHDKISASCFQSIASGIFRYPSPKTHRLPCTHHDLQPMVDFFINLYIDEQVLYIYTSIYIHQGPLSYGKEFQRTNYMPGKETLYFVCPRSVSMDVPWFLCCAEGTLKQLRLLRDRSARGKCQRRRRKRNP